MTAQKTKPAIALWVIRHRKALGMKPPDVAKAVGASADTVRGWESGRGIGPDLLHALEKLFDEDAPNGGSVPTGDLAGAISALAAELRLWRTEDRGRIAELEAWMDQTIERTLGAPGTAGAVAPRARRKTAG